MSQVVLVIDSEDCGSSLRILIRPQGDQRHIVCEQIMLGLKLSEVLGAFSCIGPAWCVACALGGLGIAVQGIWIDGIFRDVS